MVRRGLDKMKNILSWLTLILLINSLISCSAMSVKVRGCGEGVTDNRFSDYIFDGPYTIKQATQIYNKETKSNPSRGLASSWESFLTEVNASSCIYRFTSSDADWDKLKGVKGFALTHNTKVVNIVIIKKS